MTVSHGVVPDRAARAARGGLAPLGRTLASAGVSANVITALGVGLTLAGAALLAREEPLAALGALVAGSIADTLDGVVARASGGGTRLGAFLDSTADRLADAALFAAAIVVAAMRDDGALLAASLWAMAASFLVPYIRAKAESLGLSATVGPAPREARLVILLLGIAAWAGTSSVWPFTAAVAAVAILATITLVLRVKAVTTAIAGEHE